ncbi:MAG TPA: sulfurtransferase [Leucothrix sp.]|nr:sulfurtransferase [Leucothrix sp.]
MKKILFSLLLILSSHFAVAYDLSKITKKWQHTPFELYLSAQEAYDMKTADPDKVLLLDVRNQAEIHYTGIPDTVDANIPYRFDSAVWKMKKKGNFGTFKAPKNPDFVEAVENLLKAKNLSKESPVIIMCATGSRAPFATKLLHKAGFKKVYAQMEGFEGVKSKKDGKDKGKRVVAGWKVSNLPWSYNLVPEKMYFNFEPKKKADDKKASD